MSGDEFLILLLAALATLGAWIPWYRRLAKVGRFPSPAPHRVQLLLAPPACLALLLLALRNLASHDVRDDPTYLVFYGVVGAAWIGGAAIAIPLLGVSLRDDALERRNPAAAHALSGALLGATLCFAGGNVGDGPGWWVVLFSALLSTGAFFGLWLALESLAKVSESVTIDRDGASGLRLAAFLAATGAILGRSVAGDWTTAGTAARDFVDVGWPALPLALLAALVEKSLRPSSARPKPQPWTHGVLPGALYGIAASIYLVARGKW